MINIKIIEIDDFKVMHISSKPPRIEAQVVFNREHISQKLMFTLMEISHTYGFGCSPPVFGDEEDGSMTFLIGTIMPSVRSLNKYLSRMKECLNEVASFAMDFSQQMDFRILDLSMFHDIDVQEMYPEQLAAIRDQYYDGSWEKYQESVLKNGRIEEADIIGRCRIFENENQKDIGLVGHKLGYILEEIMMEPPGSGAGFN